MMETIKIYEDGRAYFPRKMTKEMHGDIPLLRNAITATVVKPGATKEEIAHSLSIALADLYLNEGERVNVEMKVTPAE